MWHPLWRRQVHCLEQIVMLLILCRQVTGMRHAGQVLHHSTHHAMHQGLCALVRGAMSCKTLMTTKADGTPLQGNRESCSRLRSAQGEHTSDNMQCRTRGLLPMYNVVWAVNHSMLMLIFGCQGS